MDPKDALKEKLETTISTANEAKASSDAANAAIEKLTIKVSEFTDEQRKKFAEFDEVQKARKFGVSVPGVNDGEQKFSFAKACHALSLMKRYGLQAFEKAGAQYEYEVFEATAAKAQTVGVDSSGGFLVPQQVMQEQFIEILRDKLVFTKLGITELNGLVSQPVIIPSQTGGATAFWVGENEAPTESEITLGEKKLEPKKAAALVKMSNKLLRMANPAAERLVRNDMAATLARLIEVAGLRGTGNKQPRGISQTPNIQTLAMGNPDGGRFTYDQMVDAIGLLEDANADTLGTPKILMHNKVKRHLKKQRYENYAAQPEATSPYILNKPPVSDAELAQWLGYEFVTTNQIRTNLAKGASGNVLSELYIGVWSEFLMGLWGTMELKASDVTGDATGSAFTQDLTWILATMSCDFQLRHEGAMVYINDAETA